MSWIYRQRSRQLEHNGRPYTRAREQQVPVQDAVTLDAREGHSPLPRGRYRIGAPAAHAQTGAFTLSLTPSVTNHAAQRSGYQIHGPEPIHAEGRIAGSLVLPLSLRRLIWSSGDRSLDVVS